MYWQVTTSDPQKSSIDGRAEDEEEEEEEKVTEQHFVFGEWRKIFVWVSALILPVRQRSPVQISPNNPGRCLCKFLG